MKKFKKITVEDFNKYENENIVVDTKLNLVSEVKEQINFNLNINYNSLKESLIECESPIEQMLSMELKNLHLENSVLFNSDLEIVGFESQKEIECNKNKYRVDFLIPVIFYKNICKCYIVECDGYEFHQKTKEQVQNDYIRQRNIEMSGYRIIKFTGTEIFNNAPSCALQVLEYIKKDYERIGNEYGIKKNS